MIKVTESMPGDEEAKEKEWALQFVKEEILKSFSAPRSNLTTTATRRRNPPETLFWIR